MLLLKRNSAKRRGRGRSKENLLNSNCHFIAFLAVVVVVFFEFSRRNRSLSQSLFVLFFAACFYLMRTNGFECMYVFLAIEKKNEQAN